MTALTISKSTVIQEQKLILPGYYDWQQFKALQSLIDQQPGVKISYLDGVIALMTLGETHEMIKSMIAILLGIYFWQR
jgi:Uma2 family endonuclease